MAHSEASSPVLPAVPGPPRAEFDSLKRGDRGAGRPAPQCHSLEHHLRVDAREALNAVLRSTTSRSWWSVLRHASSRCGSACRSMPSSSGRCLGKQACTSHAAGGYADLTAVAADQQHARQNEFVALVKLVFMMGLGSLEDERQFKPCRLCRTRPATGWMGTLRCAHVHAGSV